MVDRNTIARILVIIGGILQLVYLIAHGGIGFLLFFIFILAAAFAPDDPLLPIAGLTVVSLLLNTFIGFVFMVLWFVWASDPGSRRIALIITGIIGIVLIGLIPAILSFLLFGIEWPISWLFPLMTAFIPGLLVLIGALIAPKPLEA